MKRGQLSRKIMDAKARTNFVEEFDLPSEVKELESRKPWPQGLTSKILLKSEDFRILLVAMQAGAHMKEHHNDGRISIQTFKGSIQVRVNNETRMLRSGALLAIDRSIKHDVIALEDSIFVLTIAWPSDRELTAMKHRGYGS